MNSHKLFSLQVQISAYLDNVFDVAALMEDSETKTAALEKVAELEDELGHVSDILHLPAWLFSCYRVRSARSKSRPRSTLHT